MKRLLIAFAGTAALLACAAQAQESRAQGTQQAAAPAPATGSRVMMLRVYVADINRAVDFYHEVFGATVLQQMGGTVRITTLPGGLPGIILIQSPEEATMNGSWVMQVQDLQGTLARASAHGGRLLNTHFEAGQGGFAAQAAPAQSTHIVDPDGNVIELLQMGASH